MPTTIRTSGRPRPGSQADPSTQGVVWQFLAGKLGVRRTAEERDEATVERGLRVAAFLRGEPSAGFWPEVLRPTLLDIGDEFLEKLLADARAGVPSDRLWMLVGELDAWERIVQAIDSSITLAQGAMERLAARRLRMTAAAEAAKEREQTA